VEQTVPSAVVDVGGFLRWQKVAVFGDIQIAGNWRRSA